MIENQKIKYCLTCIDVHSKLAQISLLPHKKGWIVAQAMEEFFDIDHPKAIQSDNGSEFIDYQFENLLKKYGIKHILSNPHSPWWVYIFILF